MIFLNTISESKNTQTPKSKVNIEELQGLTTNFKDILKNSININMQELKDDTIFQRETICFENITEVHQEKTTSLLKFINFILNKTKENDKEDLNLKEIFEHINAALEDDEDEETPTTGIGISLKIQNLIEMFDVEQNTPAINIAKENNIKNIPENTEINTLSVDNTSSLNNTKTTDTLPLKEFNLDLDVKKSFETSNTEDLQELLLKLDNTCTETNLSIEELDLINKVVQKTLTQNTKDTKDTKKSTLITEGVPLSEKKEEKNIIHNNLILRLSTDNQKLTEDNIVKTKEHETLNKFLLEVKEKVLSLENGESTIIKLKLYPSKLGYIQVDIKNVNKKVSIDVISENKEVSNFFKDNAEYISKQFKQQGLNVEVSSQNKQNNPNQTKQQQTFNKSTFQNNTITNIQVNKVLKNFSSSDLDIFV